MIIAKVCGIIAVTGGIGATIGFLFGSDKCRDDAHDILSFVLIGVLAALDICLIAALI